MGSKRQYVPLLLRWPGGNTYLRLYQEFGYAGPLLWTNYLVACKRNDPEGQLEYVNESDGWHKLAMGPPLTPDFTLEDFFNVTGRMKNTSRRRVGGYTHVRCSRWADTNKAWESQQRLERRTRKTQDSVRTVSGQSPADARRMSGQSPVARAEAEAEAERTEELTAEQNRTTTTSRPAATPPAALPDHDQPEPLADIVQRITANGHGRHAPPGSVERLLEVIPLEDQDANTYETIRRAIDPLSVHSTEMLREELLAAGPEIRSRAKYAVKIAQRMASRRG